MTSDFFIGIYRQKILQNLGLVNVLIKMAVRTLFRPAVVRYYANINRLIYISKYFENNSCKIVGI